MANRYEDQYGNSFDWDEMNALVNAGSGGAGYTPSMWIKLVLFFAFVAFCVFALYAPAAAMWAFLPFESLIHL